MPLLALLLAACGRDGAPPPDTTAASGARVLGDSGAPLTAPPRPGATLGGKPACPPTGRWGACHLRERLDRAGLSPRDTTPSAEAPTLGVTPVAYVLGRGMLHVYLFTDVAARERAMRAIDRALWAAPDEALGPQHHGTAVASENLLVLLETRREHLRERVADAVQAGPPQPDPTVNPRTP